MYYYSITYSVCIIYHAFRNFFKNESSTHRLLIIQCDNGHENIDLIACARYRTKDERSKQQSYGVTHVVFVVQLPRMNGGTKFPSFQGGPWISTHIDDLHGNDNATNTIKQAIHSSMSSFFKEFCLTSEESSIFHPISLLSGCIHKALAQLMSAQFSGRAEQLIEIMFQLISRSTNAEAISEVSGMYYYNNIVMCVIKWYLTSVNLHYVFNFQKYINNF